MNSSMIDEGVAIIIMSREYRSDGTCFAFSDHSKDDVGLHEQNRVAKPSQHCIN